MPTETRNENRRRKRRGKQKLAQAKPISAKRGIFPD
jgi:hypothetical protein